jgi:DNA polymerase-1
VVTDRAGLEAVKTAVSAAGVVVAVDVETTGLDPRADRLRLLSIATTSDSGGCSCHLVDCFAVDPSPLWPSMAGKDLVFHNAAFDLAFLAGAGFTPGGKVHDTMLLAQLLVAGTKESVSLAACCKRSLGLALDKEQQKSDWAGALTEAQLAYAARDARVLPPLLRALAAKVKEAGLAEAARIEHRCLPAVAWMARQGVAVDRDAWAALSRRAEEEARRLRLELDATAPAKPADPARPGGWNWGSHAQVKEAFALAGVELADTKDETLAKARHPLAALLRRYRAAQKQASAFGEGWLEHVGADGRVYPGWRQIGAGASGRMSCKQPNMQQLPRGGHRLCIVAPPGRVLVKADYSQVELRIAAKVSGDEALLEAYRRGDDLHAITSRGVLGVAEATKADRQLAKALNFGLLYGMGHRGLMAYAKSKYGLDMTAEEARRYREAFFKAYPGLASWHRSVRARGAGETRTLSGRRRLLDAATPDTHRLNTPVQGTGADGLKLALALLWERRGECPGAFPVLAVHDEIVVEADEGQADAAAEWLKSAMADAMAPLIAPVPVEVEVTVGRSWGDGG